MSGGQQSEHPCQLFSDFDSMICSIL